MTQFLNHIINSNLVPGQLKGIQTGTISIADTASSVNATITAVTMNKAFLVFTYYADSDYDDADDCLVRGKINTSTQLTFTRSGTYKAIYIRYFVIEFTAASGVTVQRGTKTMTAATDNVTITACVLNQSFPIISWTDNGSDYNESDSMAAEITTTTNLQFRSYSSISQVVEWQVIQNPNFTVAKYTDTLSAGTKDTTITAVTLANAWLLSTAKQTGVQNLVGDEFFRTGFTSTTNIRAERNGSTPNFDLVYYVITSNKIRAQHHQYTITNGTSSNTQALSPVITVANSFITQSGINVSHASNQAIGVNSDDANRLCIRHTIDSSSQISAARSYNVDTVEFEAQVIDFSNV